MEELEKWMGRVFIAIAFLVVVQLVQCRAMLDVTERLVWLEETGKARPACHD